MPLPLVPATRRGRGRGEDGDRLHDTQTKKKLTTVMARLVPRKFRQQTHLEFGRQTRGNKEEKARCQGPEAG